MPVGTRGRSPKDKILVNIIIDQESQCWVWTRPLNDGYGRITYKGKDWMAHKLSYVAFRGEYDFSLELDHKCRNRACVNPWHLEPVTRKENSNRGLDRYSRPVNSCTCVNGHARQANKTTAGSGCKACNAETSKRYRARKRA